MSDLNAAVERAFADFTQHMRERLELFTGERSMDDATLADALWLLMRAKRNLDRFIDKLIDRKGSPSADDLYDAGNLMALADELWLKARRERREAHESEER